MEGAFLDDEDEIPTASESALIEHVAPERTEMSKALPKRRVYNVMEIMRSEIIIKFVLEGLLPDTGLMYIGARSGTGKTIIGIQLAVDIVLGRSTMGFKLGENVPQQRVIYLSLEMGMAEFKVRFGDMYPNLTEEEEKLLEENLLVYCEPEAFRLWTDDHAVDLIELLIHHKATGMIIDTASVSFGSTLLNQEEVNKTIENLYTIRNRLGVYMIVPCHTRKLPAGIVSSLEDITVDEIFGHSGVAQSASSVLMMYHEKKDHAKRAKAKQLKEGEKLIWFMNPKSRFGPEFVPFESVLRTGPLQFRRDAFELPPLTAEQKAAIKSGKTSLPETMKNIDFGSLDDDDDDDGAFL